MWDFGLRVSGKGLGFRSLGYRLNGVVFRVGCPLVEALRMRNPSPILDTQIVLYCNV